MGEGTAAWALGSKMARTCLVIDANSEFWGIESTGNLRLG